MRKLFIILVVMCIGINASVMAQHPGHEQKKPEKEGREKKQVVLQTTCPVSNEEIDRKLYVEHNGKRIYVCCKKCAKKVNGDPEKYIENLESAGITLDKVQTKCPVMGGEIKENKLFADYDGKRVYFCCAMCPEKFKKDPASYVKKLEDDGITLERIGKSANHDEGHEEHEHHEHGHH